MRNSSTHLRTRTLSALAAAFASLSFIAGCATNTPNANGQAPIDLDPGTKGPVTGVGIESQDVVAMTNRMMRDMLANPELAGKDTPPRVIIDAEEFKNSGSQILNRNTIVNRLRVELNRAAQGRMKFVGRHYARSVEDERDLKRSGKTDVGTTGLSKAALGADYRLGGEITSMDSRSGKSGMQQRYSQIVFEMFDLETQEIVWSGMYELSRAAADDVVYR